MAPSHTGRDRDVLFVDTTTLLATAGKKDASIGQNVTIEGDVVGHWCVGDLIAFTNTSGGPEGPVVRITSCRKPCPKNDTVWGPGTRKHMMTLGAGGEICVHL